MTIILEHHTSRKRGGLPAMTGKMLVVLKRLRDEKQRGNLHVDLSDVHKRTLNTLFERDWIFASAGLDGVRYVITGRGMKALAIYEGTGHNFNGVCRCGKAQRGYYKSGKRKPYCDDCLKEHGRKQYALKGWQLREDTLCSRCHKRPRHVYPSGKRIAYCSHCRSILRKQERKRKVKRRLWLIAIGRPPRCCAPGCTEAVYHTERSVYDYCYKHYRQYQNAYMRQRAQKSA